MTKKDKNIPYLVIQLLLVLTIVVFLILYLCDTKVWGIDNWEMILNAFACLVLSFVLNISIALKIKSTKTLQTYYIIALIFHFIGGGAFNLYSYNKYFNYILHFFNCFLIGVIIYGMILRNANSSGKLFMFLMTVSCVIAIGVIWEIYEFSVDSLLGKNMQRFRNSITGEPFVGQEALWDTMKDLICDTVGGGLAGIFAYPIKIAGKRLYQVFELKSAIPRNSLLGNLRDVPDFSIEQEQTVADLDDDEIEFNNHNKTG